MKPLRSRAMIASAMSLVRLTGRRRATAADAAVNTTEPPGTPCPTSRPIDLELITDRAAPMSYSLIGW
jgi:hypothetical protein